MNPILFPGIYAIKPLRPVSSDRIGPGVRNHRKGWHTSIALCNRHTGQPHQHAREIERRTRRGF